MNRFRYAVWGLLIYNLLVILWGAYVRATGSGAGCGAHWPACNGVIIPQSPAVETMIEFTHRIMSGFSLIFVIGLFIWAIRVFPKGHLVRLGAGLSLIFTVTEALVGAGLVLFKLVAGNDSIARTVSIAVHLVNTFLLLAALTLTAWWASGGGAIHLRKENKFAWGIGFGWLVLLLLGATGAVTALGDTLFPAGSLIEGMEQDFSPTAHFLIRLRVIHPAIAVLTGIYISLIVFFARRRNPTREVILNSNLLILLFVIQLGLGLLNVILLAPTWMQLVHLLVADLVWIGFVWLTAVTFHQSRVKDSIVEKATLQIPQQGYN